MLRQILILLYIHIVLVRYISLNFCKQSFCLWKLGSKPTKVDFFTLAQFSIPSVHQSVSTEQREFNTHWRPIFRLGVSQYTPDVFYKQLVHKPLYSIL